MAEFLAGSPHVRWTRPIGDFADALGIDREEGVLAWARALEGAINSTIVYTPRRDPGGHPRGGGGAVGRGVCQDMAHLMIAICRRHGVASRYVSGWLYQPGSEGPGESHAWVEAAIPGLGWVELDPTHPAPRHERYVRLATGRDYTDVPPLRGSYLGPATEEMTVTVEIKELPS